MKLRNFALAATAVLAFGSAAVAKEVPSGTVTIDETQFGFILGGSTGGGTLNYKGKSYPFKIGGLSLGNVGISKVKGHGEVFNLKDVKQFAGTYAKAEASATLVKGAGSLRLQNDNGVILQLETDSGGLQLAVGGGGVKVTMKK